MISRVCKRDREKNVKINKSWGDSFGWNKIFFSHLKVPFVIKLYTLRNRYLINKKAGTC